MGEVTKNKVIALTPVQATAGARRRTKEVLEKRYFPSDSMRNQKSRIESIQRRLDRLKDFGPVTDNPVLYASMVRALSALSESALFSLGIEDDT